MDTVALANQIHDAWTTWRPDGIFIDGGGVGGGVVDNCRAKALYVTEIQFGAKDSITGLINNTSGEKYANMRAAMYGACRAWLRTGMLPYDANLRTAMLAIKYTIKESTGEIILTPKEDILNDHPDIDLDSLDGLCLTFGGPLVPHQLAGGDRPQTPLHVSEYNPFDPKFMEAAE